MKMFKVVIAAVLVTAAFSVSAQVEVVDRHIAKPKSDNSQSAPANSGNVNVAELYYQFQLLQQEVQQLRGLVEEQNHQISKLKEQTFSDYINLDRRISGLSGGATTSSAVDSAGAKEDKVAQQVSPEAAAGELASYKSAINLLLKQQKHDDAIAALKKHLEEYPDGRYAANSHYWLGEIYLVKNDLAASTEWFERLLSDYPKHSKATDAQFKLGKVYHMQGKESEAKTILQQVANTNSNAAQLAKDYLNSNF